MIDARNYIAADTLKDGTPVTIRAIGENDRSGLLTAFETLDRELVYTRFFTYKRGLTERELQNSPRWIPIVWLRSWSRRRSQVWIS